MFSLAMWSLWSVDGNNQLMKRLLPNVIAYDNYFERTRASKQVPGLLLVNRWSDSGMDNSRRWGNQNNRCLRGARHYDEVDWEMPVISVDVNVYNITEKICLAKMCRAAGMNAEADRLEAQAEKREEILHRELWDSERGSYFDRVEADGRFTPVIAPTNLSPLMLKKLPADRVKPLLGWLFDERHFWGEYPIPSIAKSDPHFETAGGYWMGPVWMSYPMDILRGLNYHDKAAAARLLDRLLNIMLPGGEPAIYENYHPLNGQPMECPNFSWNGQIIDIIMRDMFGISFVDGEVSATSAGVPDDWDSWKVKGVVLHGKRYTISAKKSRGCWRHEIKEEKQEVNGHGFGKGIFKL
jgi:putative isomerase